MKNREKQNVLGKEDSEGSILIINRLLVYSRISRI